MIRRVLGWETADDPVAEAMADADLGEPFAEDTVEPTDEAGDLEALLADVERIRQERDTLSKRLGYLNSQGFARLAAINRLIQRDPARWVSDPPAGYRARVTLEPTDEA